MARQLKQSYMSLTAGGNVDESPFRLIQESLILGQNAVYDEGGNITKRPGSKLAVTEPVRDNNNINAIPWNQIFVYKKYDGTEELIGFAGDRSYKIDIDDNTITKLGTDFTEGLIWNATNYFGVFICTNGTDKIQRYDGTTWTTLDNDLNSGTLSNIPYAKYVFAHRNHLFVAVIRYSTSDPLQYNKTAYSPIDWEIRSDFVSGSVADWVRVDVLGSEMDNRSVLTGLGAYGQDLLFFTRDSVHRLVGSSNYDYGLIPIGGNLGTVSHNSIIQTPTATLFFTESGLGAYNGGVPFIISDGINRYLRSIDDSRFENIVATHYKGNVIKRDLYYFFCTLKFPGETITHNNFGLIYDIKRNAWFTNTGQDADGVAVGETNERDVMYYGDRNGLVYQVDDILPDDNGVPIDWYIVLGALTFGDPESEFIFSIIDLFYGSLESVSTLKFTMSPDLMDLTDSSGDQVAPNSVDVRLPATKVSKLFDPVKWVEQEVWDSYARGKITLLINEVGSNLFLGISNSDPSNFFIEGIGIRGHAMGEYREITA
ncbi:MAG TPA: hypothetical protein ENH82_10480 [bacterium]|nr:hypothetical protein [bacterium]